MISLEQKLLFDVVHAFLSTNKPEALRNGAFGRALAYLSDTLTDAQFESLKATLPDQ
jgi:hypothetical protein